MAEYSTNNNVAYRHRNSTIIKSRKESKGDEIHERDFRVSNPSHIDTSNRGSHIPEDNAISAFERMKEDMEKIEEEYTKLARAYSNF
mmetsp:Transcript_8517/g.7552  ORF Transcript_8517/g.7552 Transcript_8517/m.7552 type:complete len:87 (+) Transcript_8517:1069-1329(+)